MYAMKSNLPDELKTRIAGAFGADGRRWLEELPEILVRLQEQWSLQLQPPFPNLSYHYVAPAVDAAGKTVVLKAGVPHRELNNQIDALALFEGRGAVRLISADKEIGAMLLEHVSPGRSLEGVQDDTRATSIFAAIARHLSCQAPEHHDFPHVGEWARGFERYRRRFNGDSGPIAESMLGRAHGVMQDLLDSVTTTCVLHGDLHHGNILSAEREPWVAIDPKGVIGEPEYEVGAWLRNPMPGLLKVDSPARTVSRRVDQLADELGFDRSRMISWGFCQAVLAGIWSIEEDLPDWKQWLTCAELLSKLTVA
jgi:streptomycin 6-kinase